MCGRFALHHPAHEIHETFNIERPIFLVEPRYNIAPTQTLAVVTPARDLVGMRWGLVPKWSKDGRPYINARAETIAQKPAFAGALRARRIVVPCSGFYEWRTEGKLKVALHIRLRGGELFGIAAVWELAEALPTVALITVAANDAVRQVHDRMPAILRRGEWAGWIDPINSAPEALLRPLPEDDLELFTVSNRVNRVSEDDASLVQPERRGLFGG